MAENKTLEHLPEVRAAVAALSPEDRKLLAAVQASPFKLTAPEQFKEFAANIDYFVFEPNIHDLNDLGWRYLAQHMDMLLPPELLKAIDPVPFGKYAMQEEQGHFTEHRSILSLRRRVEHERPAEPEKKPSIRERLEQGKKECAEKSKAHPIRKSLRRNCKEVLICHITITTRIIPLPPLSPILGKYNEGELVGEWVKFPTTAEELKEVFKRIGIGQKDDFGQPYEEWFITDYDCYVDGLYSKLGEYENLDELNYLASKLDEMSESEYAVSGWYGNGRP